MPLEIRRSDITKMEVEAVVFAKAASGYSTDTSREMSEPVLEPGTGTAAKYHIHAAAARCADEEQQEKALRAFYQKCLSLADEKGIRSLAFPLIPLGRGMLARLRGVRIAAEEIRAYTEKREMQVCLVVPAFDPLGMGRRLRRRLDEYIEENLIPVQGSMTMDASVDAGVSDASVDADISDASGGAEDADYSDALACSEMPSLYGDEDGLPDGVPAEKRPAQSRPAKKRPAQSRPAKKSPSESRPAARGSDPMEELERRLAERMEHLSDTFSEYLLYLIRMKGMTNAEVYKRAIVDKKVFSKIRNNPDYHPQKRTALCLCVGARLSLDEAKDLLARAGYALSPCDKTDIIFSYFIEHKIYDMIELDIQLEEHGLPCIIE